MGESIASKRHRLMLALGSIGLFVILCLGAWHQWQTAQSAQAAETLPTKTTSYYQDYKTDTSDARFDLMGAAQKFHIFTNNLIGNTSFSGNIAVGDVNLNNALTNDGDYTDIADGQPNYIAKATHLYSEQGQTGLTLTGKAEVIFGPDVNVSLSNGDNRLSINGVISGDSFMPNAGYPIVEKAASDTSYLDFPAEFTHLKHLSKEFSANKTSAGVYKEITVTDEKTNTTTTTKVPADSTEVSTTTNQAGVKTDDNHTTFNVGDAVPTYPIQLTKVGSDGQLLADVQFKLFDADGNPVKDSSNNQVILTTGADGQARYNVASPGKYQVQEVSAPKGYTLDSSMHTITAAKRDATYINLDAATALGDSGTKSQLIIKGVATNSKGTDGNPGPIIINVDCANYSIEHDYAFPDIILEDASGQPFDEANEDKRVIWNFYGVPENTGDLANAPSGFSGPLLNVGNDIIRGTILAPEANVILNSSKLYGMIAANQVDMANTSSMREPLDFPLFTGDNDIIVPNNTVSDTTTTWNIKKVWESLSEYKQEASDYPDIKATLNATDKDERDVSAMTATLSGDPTAKTPWQYQFTRLPAYGPAQKLDAMPSDCNISDLLKSWVTWYQSPKTAFADATNAQKVADGTWFKQIGANSDDPITYSVTEDPLPATSDNVTGLDAYQAQSKTDGTTTTLTNTQFGVSVQKFATDQTDKPLNATFEATDSETNEKVTFTTGTDSTTNHLKPMAPGTWQIRETKSPAGYQLDEQTYTYKLSKDGKWTDETDQTIGAQQPASGTTGFYTTQDYANTDHSDLNNLLNFVQYDRPLWTVKINKVDDAGQKSLSNAQFSIADKILTTDDTGSATTDATLKSDATYTLSETQAPEGYAKLLGDATVKLTETGDNATVAKADGFTGTAEVDKASHTITFTIQNRKKGHLPSTGGTGFLKPLELSLSLFTAAMLLFILAWWQRRKAGDAA